MCEKNDPSRRKNFVGEKVSVAKNHRRLTKFYDFLPKKCLTLRNLRNTSSLKVKGVFT